MKQIFHNHEKWECLKAGFFKTKVEGKTTEECQQEYCDFLKDDELFRAALERVTNEWLFSCEHNLTNTSVNRIAWLGQASMCLAKGIPSKFCGGFNLLTKDQQDKANETAKEYLDKWIENYSKNG